MPDERPNASSSTGGGDTGFRRKFSAQDYQPPVEQDRGDGVQSHGVVRKRKQRVVDSVLQVSAQNLGRPDGIDFTTIVNKKRIVQAAVKDTGFHCSLCNMVFKDNIAFLDHLTTREHLTKAGVDPTRKSTLSDVIVRFEELKAKRRAELEQLGNDSVDPVQLLQDRIQSRQDQLLEIKRKKAAARKLKNKQQQPEDQTAAEHEDLFAVMGFSTFAKKK